MSDQPSPDYRSLMLTAVALAVVGWLGLFTLLRSTLPTVVPRWLFFFLWALAATGTSLPFIWMLHRRFASEHPAPPWVLLRHGLWAGLYASTCLWLQVNRSLSIALALALFVGLVAFEWFLGLLERSTWRPDH
jgi:hypothetical protein